MVKLAVLPELSIIDGFKGVIDFYLHDGIPCARRWPRSPGRRRAHAVEAQWPAFTYASKHWHTLPPELRDAYRTTAKGTNLTGRDLFVKSFISTFYLTFEGF